MTVVDAGLIEWANPQQIAYIDAVNEHGSNRAAAAALGVNESTIRRSLKVLEEKAAVRGYHPASDLTQPTAPGFLSKGHSILYKVDPETGEQTPKLVWHKTKADEEFRAKLIEQAIVAATDDLPRLAPLPRPVGLKAQLLNNYTLTDCHMGMLAWHREGGADWDLKIAEDTLTKVFEQMIAQAPPAATCVINQLGDFLHFDGMSPVTPTSGHIVDTDSRYSKIVDAVIRVLRRIVDYALQRHETVHLVLAEGNHDIASSVWLRALFKALYANEPRLRLVDSELPYYALKHGKVFLGYTHGHLKRGTALPLLFATTYRQLFGETNFTYIHTGHEHHLEVVDQQGVIWTKHSTIAARDAHAARHGYDAERRATCHTYHAEFGEVGQTTIHPEMLL